MNTFNNLEKTRIYQSRDRSWTGETFVKVNGKNWILTTMKRYNGVICTHCKTAAEDHGNGSYVITDMFGNNKAEDFYLNEQVKGTKATEKTIREVHYKSLADFDAKKEDGTLPDVKKEYQVEIGQILFTDGPFDEHPRAVYEIDKTKWGTNYKTVHLDGSRTSTDNYIKNYSQKFGIGVYYKEGDKISQDEINNLLIRAKVNMELTAAKEAAQSIINAAQSAEKAKYLSQFIRADRRKTTEIVKRHVLNTWKEVSKIQVQTAVYSGGDSMDITYYSPAKIEALETFIDSFQEGHFNGMIDLYEYNDNEAIILEGHILQTYKYTFARFEKSDEIREVKEVKETLTDLSDYEIVDYSEKALAVFGNTKAIKEDLKSLGGRFNAYLTWNGTKAAGWIFSKKAAESLNKLLGK